MKPPTQKEEPAKTEVCPLCGQPLLVDQQKCHTRYRRGLDGASADFRLAHLDCHMKMATEGQKRDRFRG